MLMHYKSHWRIVASIASLLVRHTDWGLRDYGVDGQLGLEPTPEEYTAHMVQVFREVWRVLRDDGTLWLNLGDSYASDPTGSRKPTDKSYSDRGVNFDRTPKIVAGLKPKDLVGIPWRVAFALQADGWYLRSDIIWHKPNPMPESVTDRPTKAHEYVFLLSKQARYYYDAEAVKEPLTYPDDAIRDRSRIGAKHEAAIGGNLLERKNMTVDMSSGRNRRTVWTIATAPYSGAHFATYPPALVEPCIKAGTSARGVCPICGAQWERVTKTDYVASNDGGGMGTYRDDSRAYRGCAERKRRIDTTLGWQPTCSHDADPVPAVVFDPFNGSGTTGLVAQQLGRRYVGLDLSFDYLMLARERLGMKALDEWENGIQAGNDGWHDLPLFQ